MSDFKPTTGFVNIGDFFVCNCGVPLAKRTGLHEYDLTKIHRGKKVTVKVQAEGGILKVKCRKCGRGFNYIQLKEKMGIVDNVTIAKKPSGAKLIK